MDMNLKELSVNDLEEIKEFFFQVFTKEPWNDDWSDSSQLHAYIMDLTGNPNSLSLGLFLEEELIGIALGNIKHWYAGTEYCIDELCIKTDQQGKGIGTGFIKLIEEYLKKKGIGSIFLQTERAVPAYEFYKKKGFFELEDHVSFVKDF